MLTVSNLDKAFGEKQILRSFSYEFPAQGIFCLFGPSGCGKTTLLRIMAGLEQPDAGTVQCDGRLSMVFQEDRLLPWMTAEKNIFITNDPHTNAPHNMILCDPVLLVYIQRPVHRHRQHRLCSNTNYIQHVIN